MRHFLDLRIVWFGLSLLTTSMTAGCAVAAETPDPTFDRLAKIGLFAFGGIGIAGHRSEGEQAYYDILARPQAAGEFERLLIIGSPQAKCYGLVGLHRLLPEKFHELCSTLRDSTVKVSVARGCILGLQTMSQVVHSIESGGYSHY